MGCGIVVNQVWAGRSADGIEFRPGAVEKQDLIKNGNGAATLFAFDAGQAIAEHTAPFDALLLGVEGTGKVTVDGQAHDLGPGDMVLIPAHKPHALEAPERFKMVLTMLRA